MLELIPITFDLFDTAYGTVSSNPPTHHQYRDIGINESLQANGQCGGIEGMSGYPLMYVAKSNSCVLVNKWPFLVKNQSKIGQNGRFSIF